VFRCPTGPEVSTTLAESHILGNGFVGESSRGIVRVDIVSPSAVTSGSRGSNTGLAHEPSETSFCYRQIARGYLSLVISHSVSPLTILHTRSKYTDLCRAVLIFASLSLSFSWKIDNYKRRSNFDRQLSSTRLGDEILEADPSSRRNPPMKLFA